LEAGLLWNSRELDDPVLAERLGEPIPFRYVTCVQVAKRLWSR
jgi:hypothetical protein